MKLTLKNRLKLYILPDVVRVLHLLGVGHEKLGNISFLTKSNLLVQASRLSKLNIEKSKGPQQVVYAATLLTGSMFMLAIEALLGLALKKRGHKVTYIIDDNFLPIHEYKKIGEEKDWNYKSYASYVFADAFLKRMGHESLALSKFIDKDIDSLVYDKRFDSIQEASLLKHYKVGVISPDLPLVEEKKELIKKSIAITTYLGEVLIQKNPDLVIMSHGIYSTWGPIFQFLDASRINILMYGRGKKRHTLKFDWNKTGDSWDISAFWNKVKNNDLTSDQLNEINQYLDSRISHKEDVFVYNFGKKTSNDETISQLGLETDKPIYTLFTNVLWDAASAQREIAFKNPVEWVIETIEWFNDQPDKQLIVKIHPAEIVIGTNMPFYDIILSRVTPNKNVRIIKPEEKVNSWSIYAISTLGMVHTTTAGMEMPLVSKPCVVVSKTHYRNKGFTLDINSKEEYFELLQNFDAESVDYEKNKKEAIKYAYLLFMRYQMPFNSFYEETSTDIRGFRKNNIDEYLKDEVFEFIVNSIEKKEPIFMKV